MLELKPVLEPELEPVLVLEEGGKQEEEAEKSVRGTCVAWREMLRGRMAGGGNHYTTMSGGKIDGRIVPFSESKRCPHPALPPCPACRIHAPCHPSRVRSPPPQDERVEETTEERIEERASGGESRRPGGVLSVWRVAWHPLHRAAVAAVAVMAAAAAAAAVVVVAAEEVEAIPEVEAGGAGLGR